MGAVEHREIVPRQRQRDQVPPVRRTEPRGGASPGALRSDGAALLRQEEQPALAGNRFATADTVIERGPEAKFLHHPPEQAEPEHLDRFRGRLFQQGGGENQQLVLLAWG